MQQKKWERCRWRQYIRVVPRTRFLTTNHCIDSTHWWIYILLYHSGHTFVHDTITLMVAIFLVKCDVCLAEWCSNLSKSVNINVWLTKGEVNAQIHRYMAPNDQWYYHPGDMDEKQTYAWTQTPHKYIRHSSCRAPSIGIVLSTTCIPNTIVIDMILASDVVVS